MRLLKPLFLVTVTLLVVTLLVIPLLVRGQVAFSLFPEKFDLELSPNEVYQDQIRVSNLSNISLTINVKIKNFSAKGEKGEITFEEGGDISFDPSQWIEFKEKKFVLGPKELKKINFIIKVPPKAESGGYYATSLFQVETPIPTGGSTKILPTLGALFLLKIKGGEEKYPPLEKQFELIELNAPTFIENGPIKINFRLKNNDPVHIKAGGKLIIYNPFGKIKEEIKIDDQTILPQKIRFFEIKTKGKTFFDNFFFGPYKGELILSTQTWREKIGNERQLVKSFNFFALPWKIFLIFLIIVLLIIFIFLVEKKGRRNSIIK